MAVLHGFCSRMITVLLCAVILCYIVLGLRVLVMWPTNFCDNLLLIVRGSNAYFWSSLESGSKVFFSMFSCYIGIVLHETA